MKSFPPAGRFPGSHKRDASPPSRRQFLHALSGACMFPFLGTALHAIATKSEGLFSDVTKAAGISWKHFNGMSPDRYLIEAMGSGVGLADLHGDGSLDIFLPNGGETPRGKSERPLRNALYRNLGNGKFVDVASEAGLDQVKTYGTGVAIADYDNDGHQDIFITGFPHCQLYRNNGDGSFTDVTLDAGVQNVGRWASSAAWFDYDRDGFLDLIVCNYVQFSFDGVPPKCEYDQIRTYCEQRGYSGMPLTLYHNNHDGTFTDVSRVSGVDQFIGRALGVVAVDIDDDGWPDLFISRDGSPNLLLLNKRNGTFADAALEAEVAYDSEGNAKAGMGVDAGDVEGNGHPDFVITNFNYEFHSLFLNPGSFPFLDATRTSSLAGPTRLSVGWGAHFLDYDNDGLMDLMIVNGHINEVIEAAQSQVKYKEKPFLARNTGKGIFEDVSAIAGPAFRESYLGRGLAIGDWNNDGSIDAIFTCIAESPVLLQNNVGQRNAWIGIQLIGTHSNRDAIGSKLSLTVGGKKLVRWITGGSSYLSSHDKRIIFGLGTIQSGSKLDISIRWPNGSNQIVRSLAINQYHKIKETAQDHP